MYKRNGIWYADFNHDGKRYVKSLKVSSKSVAKEMEQKFRVEVLTGTYDRKQAIKKRNVNFEAVLNDYIENVAKVDKRSWDRDEVSAKHLKKFFCSKKFLEVNSDDVMNFKNMRQKEIMNKEKNKHKPVRDISFTTINREMSLLKRLYNWYNEQKKLNHVNPVKGIKFFAERSRNRVMTEEEEKKFFTDGKLEKHIREMVLLALYTGMRRGEIMKLRTNNVILTDIGGSIHLQDTKNGEDRNVPLNKDMAEFMKRLLDGKAKDDYVFINKRTGKPFTDIGNAFEGACDRAEIKDFRFHDLRHTFCTRAASRGVSPFFIMKIVGHKDTETAKRYVNPTEEHLINAMPPIKSHQFSQQSENSVVSAKENPKKRKVFSMG